VLPLGIGVRIHLNPDADLIVDYGYRLTFTDYLDDVSGDYAARSSISDPTALALSDRRGEIDDRFNDPAFAAKAYPHRGNSARNDAYGILSVKYQYTFSKSQFKRMRKGMKRSFKSRLNRYK
jgi:hypothetical protein